MDNTKTGEVIFSRRTELGLTQKQLADQLNLSDRTISRWERGVGFPDVSLLEPLADILGLSVLELIRGERLPQEDQPSPETERSVRETARDLSEQFRKHLKRFKWLLIALALLLGIAATFLIWLVTNPFRVYNIFTESISAAQAVAVCPEILITTDEYELLSALLELDEVCSNFSDEAILTLDEAVSAPYKSLLQANGQDPAYFHISIIHHSVYVEYRTDHDYRILAAHTLTDRVEKCVAGYSEELKTITGLDPGGQETTLFLPRDPDYVIDNFDNTEFTQSVSQRDLLAPFRR